MAVVLTAPDHESVWPDRSLFLAGGISNCDDWQSTVIKELITIPNLIIFNPRRPIFDIENFKMTEEQIEWEHSHLKHADMILFWFMEGSLNPITLFEYGRWGRLDEGFKRYSKKRIFVGTHPNYLRKYDIKIQTALDSGPPVRESLEELIDEVRIHLTVKNR